MTPKLLFLTPDLPYPPHQGAAIRSFNLIKNLVPSHEIHLLSFVQQSNASSRLGPLSTFCANVATVPAPSRSNKSRALSVLFSAEPDMALRLPSARFANQLRLCLQRERFDFVQVEAIEMAQYGLAVKRMSLPSQPQVVFDDINAEYLLQKRAFQSDIGHPTRWLGAFYSLIQWQKLQRYEAKVCRQLDRVVVVSHADGEALLELVPELHSTVVPNGVDTSYYTPTDRETESDTTLVFTGKMDFRPNVDAVLWFAREVLPLIREAVPQARFKVVGRDPHPRLNPLAERADMTLTGYVDDVRPHIAEAGVYVVPLRVGGGTRLKVLEAMSMGKAIVTTSLGCEGIDVADGRELVIADDTHTFAQSVVDLLGDTTRRRELGGVARSLVESTHDWRHITPLLEQVYEG
ncbi:MAG: glycosyl transferase family 1 [Chloroflexi bacterium B3_Chlor]|nr:MAG: glycosyl transferase family 1 [Chloroflexi bacterium B3_Chlor]